MIWTTLAFIAGFLIGIWCAVSRAARDWVVYRAIDDQWRRTLDIRDRAFGHKPTIHSIRNLKDIGVVETKDYPGRVIDGRHYKQTWARRKT